MSQEAAEAQPQQKEKPVVEQSQKSLTWSSIIKSLVAGGIAGGVSRTAVAPLERLKILMQIQGNQKRYSSVYQGLKHIAKTEGLAGMMRGNLTNCIRIVPNQAVKFLSYEQISRAISNRSLENGGDGQMTPLLRLSAGAVAGIIGMSATYPLDMVRGRLTIQEGKGQGQYRGITHATVTIIRQEGIMALWRGWLPSVIGVIPYVGLNFATYETSKEIVMRHYGLSDERDIHIVTRLACGGFAGTLGQTVAYPLDVVRRRLQVSGWAGASSLHAGEGGSSVAYKGMVDCFVRTMREEGIQAFFKGLWPNYIKVVPSISIAFVTYESLKDLMGVQVRISS
mmetsp:Transcript_10168/g.30546  ORF Transcript_10168/g.30546 Transcript_10168/m.30546 type:complete len:338 (-) Transcript_10168:678-1691(-)|eukprot:CAMPEP_0206143988 /NCGR_PEP_ID=MMETSP1473-20131121/22591_1 /ASSEMBLY_ACC=CAM_ASM_001109 /TAXON_ID=1461547 /ORGANISM="Stichococcus sp, Strain RCC1054" /LENGTH=337 /DNA_ID=CAMNT_0053539645 /DNA_START=105 /DNA_END=1118 /DNA_ORIENTATION=-